MSKLFPRTKHIALRYHFFRDKDGELEIKVVALSIYHQLTDQPIKGLTILTYSSKLESAL